MAANPTAGDLVCIAILPQQNTLLSLTVKDGNNNSYQVTPNSPASQSGAGWVYLAYLLTAPANANKTITCSWTHGVTLQIFADEFTPSGPVVFDKDIAGVGTTGTTVNSPSINPAYAGSLLYSAAITVNSMSSANSPWTASTAVSSTDFSNGFAASYDLSASANTAVNYTQTSGAWAAMAMAFYISSIPETLTDTMNNDNW